MKKLTLLLALAMPFLLSAKPVDPTTARKVAQTFLKVSTLQPRHQSQSVQELLPDQQYYVYQNPEGGYVIVSADDVAHPILGYSERGWLDMNNLPENLRWWLSEYDSQIRWAQENNVAQTEEIAREWEKVLTQPMAATPVVGPLVETYWGQEYPYNYMCPKNSANQQAITGCVATAFAQILRYWSWPEQGTASHSFNAGDFGSPFADFGSTSYDWGNMPSYYDGNPWTNAQRDAVATLMYHCGVAVDMTYGTDASYSYDWKVGAAARTFFNYGNKTQYVEAANYSAANWLFLIKEQLNNHRPMVFGGDTGKDGHAFVCDGYDTDNKLHFNWGWSGNGDGFFVVSAITYKKNQDAIINMYPQTFPKEDKIVLRAKLPSKWGTNITAWVWPTGGEGAVKPVTVEDGWATYETTDKELNIILRNGNDWNGDVNQTPDITLTRSACIFIRNLVQGQTWKPDIHFVDFAHPINLDIQLPEAWGNDAFSVWVWPHGGDGHWEELTPQDGKARLTVNSEELNAVIVKGTGHNPTLAGIYNNDMSETITIQNDACVKVGDETSGYRSCLFQDCSTSHLITVKAKKPANWGSALSAWVWEDGQQGEWKELQRNGDWYFFSTETKRLNIIFVNGAVKDWGKVGGIDNQTIDISTQQDACYLLGNNGGKKSAILTDCSEAPDQPTAVGGIVNGRGENVKILRDGQLYILYNGKMYNAQGALIDR